MKDVKLTENFKLSEFIKSEPNYYQRSLISTLAGQLQLVRNELNKILTFRKDKAKPLTMTITSGVRTNEDYNRLVAKGYNPSKTSDHFCGVQIQGTPTLGAADVVFGNLGVTYEKLYSKLVELCDSYKFNFGQIILEHNPATKVYWIHFGNDPSLIFDFNISRQIKGYRVKYLVSKDNGKTYEKYSKD